MRSPLLVTPAPRPDGPAPEPGLCGPTRVLLATDDEAMQDALAEALRAEGYHVTEVSRGPEPRCGPRRSFFHEESESPDLVTTDARGPGGPGMDVLSWLEKHDPLLPVILITAPRDDGRHEEPGLPRDEPLDVEDLVCAATLLAAPR